MKKNKRNNIDIFKFFFCLFFILISCKKNNIEKCDEEFVYNSNFSDTQLISKCKELDSIEIDILFKKIENISHISQREFAKDTNKRIIHFSQIETNKINIIFSLKDKNINYKINNNYINKLKKIDIEYINLLKEMLNEKKCLNYNLNISFFIYLPKDLYNPDSSSQIPLPPPS